MSLYSCGHLRGGAYRCFVFIAACALAALGGCKKEGASGLQGDGPAAALNALLDAAQKGDTQAFRQGLSKDFRAVVVEYEKLGEQNEEVKKVFTLETFMKAMSTNPPTPH